MILQLTEEEQRLLYPILIDLQENEINRPNIDVDKLETIEGLIEKIDAGGDEIEFGVNFYTFGGSVRIGARPTTGSSFAYGGRTP